MPDFLLDCNHLSAALRKVSSLRERIHQGRRAGHRFISCHPVLCELEAGILQTKEPEENHRRLALLLRHVRL
jgi:predicted nucleic acid-binding protein